MSITKAILIIVFYTFPLVLLATGKRAVVDSLERVLIKHNQIDTTRVNLMNELVYELYTSAPKKAKEYANEALEMARALRYHKGEAAGLWVKGLTLLSSDRKEALDYFRRALKIAEVIDDKVGMCNYLMAIGNMTKKVGDVKESNEAHRKSLQIALDLNDKGLILKALINVTKEASRSGDHETAARQLRDVIKIAEETGNQLALSRAYTNLATIYKACGDMTTALRYYHTALNLNEKRNDYRGAFLALINISKLQSAQNDVEGALGSVRQALASAREHGDSVLVSICFTNLGNIYMIRDGLKALSYFQKAQVLEKSYVQTVNNLSSIGAIYTERGEFDKAMNAFGEALSVAKKTESKRLPSDVYIRMGALFFKQKEYVHAIDYTRKALELTDEAVYVEQRKDASKQLAEIYSAVGNYKEAYLNYVRYHMLEDSLFSSENIRKIAFLESSYQFAKEKEFYEIEKVNHQLQITNQQLTIFSLSMAAVLIILLSVLLFWWSRRKKKVLQCEIGRMGQELDDNKKNITIANLKLAQNFEIAAYNAKILADIEKTTSGEERKIIRSMINEYKLQAGSSNWEEFETLFANVNSSFMDRLNELYPNLTLKERRLCVFIKLNMSNKDIARITLQSEDALKKSRQRLRKKLGLTERNINLGGFIQGL